MNRSSFFYCFLCLSILGFSSCVNKKKTSNFNSSTYEGKKVNIIYILADDLGIGDLGCYGQKDILTPNIDALAQKGMLFTQHYSGTSVCAPSRSSLMTGQHTGHTPIRGNGGDGKIKEGQLPLPKSSVTIAEMLKEAGYKTGGFGKWGLGYPGSEGDANMQGFDVFYGYNCQKQAHRYYPNHLWNNQEKEMLEGNDWKNTVTYAPEVIQKRTLDFLDDNKDNAFFAYVPYTLPHAELISPHDSIYEYYIDKFKETPYTEENKYTSAYGDHIEIHQYCPVEKPRATYATMVTRLDAYVGELVEKVQNLGISENTVIMFASDNGPHSEGGADASYFHSHGGFRGMKRDLYEGGIRSPFIVYWPSKVKAGSTSDHVSAFWDMMPTFADIAKVETPKQTDGVSFLPTLLGDENQEEHEYLYWEFHKRGGRQAVRKGNWKGVVYNVLNAKKRTFKLFDLSKDSGETNNLADQYPEIVADLENIISTARVETPVFPFLSHKK